MAEGKIGISKNKSLVHSVKKERHDKAFWQNVAHSTKVVGNVSNGLN